MLKLRPILWLVAIVMFSGSTAFGYERPKCTPWEVNFRFYQNDYDVTVNILLQSKDDTCHLSANLSEIRPLSMSIVYRGKIFEVPKNCIDSMHFDLNGVLVEQYERGLIVWVGPGLRGARDVTVRNRKEAGVWIEDGHIRECIEPSKVWH